MALLDRLRRAPSPRFAPSKGIDSGDDREKLASAGWSYHGGVPTRLFNGEKAPGALSYPSLVGVDFYTLRQRSREAAWESPQGGAMLSTLKDNVVNSGAMLVASPLWDLLGDAAPSAPEAREALRREIELRFHLWANSTDGDITGEHTVYQLMGLEYNTRNEDGETVIVMRYSKDPTLLSPLQLQFLDPDQLITSQPAGADGSCILEGVELTKLGAPRRHPRHRPRRQDRPHSLLRRLWPPLYPPPQAHHPPRPAPGRSIPRAHRPRATKAD